MATRSELVVPKYRLYYFDVKSRGESARIAFAFAAVNYEDFRISYEDTTQEWYPKMKNSGKFPFRQIPVLEVDGKTQIAQARAILRYLAREFDIGPRDSLAQAQVDMIVEKILELENSFVTLTFYDNYYEKDDKRKEELRKRFEEQFLPQSLEDLEKLAASNQEKDWFVGETLSIADIDFFAFINTYLGGGKLETPSELQGHPNLVRLYQAVMNEPKIRSWIDNRPQTEW